LSAFAAEPQEADALSEQRGSLNRPVAKIRRDTGTVPGNKFDTLPVVKKDAGLHIGEDKVKTVAGVAAKLRRQRLRKPS